MEAASRQIGQDSTTRRYLLILAGAAAVSAALFALLFEATARLTDWALRGGFAHFASLSPELRLWLAIGPSLLFMFWGLAVSARSYRQQRSRLASHRRPRGW
jgi:hypothetical protein